MALGLCRLFLDAPQKYRAVEVWRIPPTVLLLSAANVICPGRNFVMTKWLKLAMCFFIGYYYINIYVLYIDLPYIYIYIYISGRNFIEQKFHQFHPFFMRNYSKKIANMCRRRSVSRQLKGIFYSQLEKGVNTKFITASTGFLKSLFLLTYL